jgi:dephospho-CoA kinase
MDIIMAFGQKSYLLAQNQQGATIGAVGWQVENLITRADELYIAPDAPKDAVVYSLVRAIEDASRELQSEVSFIFLPDSTEEAVLQPFFQSGYEATTITEIKIPAWREAVQEVAAAADVRILTKKLRKDRVLKPI